MILFKFTISASGNSNATTSGISKISAKTTATFTGTPTSIIVNLPTITASDLNSPSKENIVNLYTEMHPIESHYNEEWNRTFKQTKDEMLNTEIKAGYKTQIKNAPYVFHYSENGDCGNCVFDGYILCDSKLNTVAEIELNEHFESGFDSQTIYSDSKTIFIGVLDTHYGNGGISDQSYQIYKLKDMDFYKIFDLSYGLWFQDNYKNLTKTDGYLSIIPDTASVYPKVYIEQIFEKGNVYKTIQEWTYNGDVYGLSKKISEPR